MSHKEKSKSGQRGSEEYVEHIPVKFEFTVFPAIWEHAGPGRLLAIHGGQTRLTDPWLMRERFLTLEHSDKELCKFLQDTGVWEDYGPYQCSNIFAWQEIIAEHAV